MEIKLVKHSLRSQKYRIFVPVEYFESMGYDENDVVDAKQYDKDENYKIYENGYYCEFCKTSVLVSNDTQYDLKDVQKERHQNYHLQPPKFKDAEIK